MLCVHVFLLFACLSAFGQEKVNLKKTGSVVEDFIPNGWALWAVTYGDLNKDKLTDVVLVIQKQDASNILTKVSGSMEVEYDANPRIIMILFKSAKGGYILAEFSDSFILKNSNPARIDPFQAVTVSSNGVLIIDFQFYYISGKEEMNNSTYKFRYQNNKFELIGVEVMKATADTGESIDHSFNFMTGKMCTTYRNLHKNTEPTEKWETFKLDELKNLKTILSPYNKWKVNNVDL